MVNYSEFENKIREKHGEDGLKLRSKILNIIDKYEETTRMTPHLFRRSNDAFQDEKLPKIRVELENALKEVEEITDYIMPQEEQRVYGVLRALELKGKDDRIEPPKPKNHYENKESYYI